MTPETEAAIIAAAVATCHAEREVTFTVLAGGGMLICGLAQGHDGPVHYDPVDGVLWAETVPGLMRDQAAEIIRRLPVTP